MQVFVYVCQKGEVLWQIRPKVTDMLSSAKQIYGHFLCNESAERKHVLFYKKKVFSQTYLY